MRLPSLRRNPSNRVRAAAGAAVTALDEPLESRTLLSAQLVKDVVPGAVGSQPSWLASLGDHLVFSTGGTQPGLWVSDSTDSGTQRISDAQVFYDSYEARRPIVTSVAHNAVFFNGPGGLWKTDGTASGTSLVRSITPPPSNGVDAFSLTESGDFVYFTANDSWSGEELWRSDGTLDGTVMVRDLYPGRDGSNRLLGSRARNLTDVNGTLFFSAASPGLGVSLWKTNGTPSGTVLVKHYVVGNNPAQEPFQFTNVNGTLFFAADDGVHGYELWKSDGTDAGTTLVRDIFPGLAGSLYRQGGMFATGGGMVALGDQLLFFARGGDTALSLWRSDGTEAGTVPVRQIVATTDGSFTIPGPLVRSGPSLAFFTSNGASELWKTDGTEAGTVLVKAFPPNTQQGITGLTSVDGKVVFTVNDGANGYEAWTSDGTSAGTVRVTDINPGSADAWPSGYTPVDDKLFFVATDVSHGEELWKIDVPQTPPAAPSGLALSALSGGEVRVAWSDNADNEAGFVLERSPTPGFETISSSVKLLPDSRQYVDVGLTPGATYYYRVSAFNSSGTSVPAGGTVDTPPSPDAPSALTVVAASHDRVDLAWADNSDNETGFHIDRSPLSTFGVVDATFDVGPDVRSFSDTSVSPEQHYYYRVSSVGPAGHSQPVVAHAVTPGLPPTGLLGWASSPTTIDLQWVNPQGTGPFVLEIDRAGPGEPFAAVGTQSPTSTRFFDDSRRPNTTYRYRVRAVGAYGSSIPTNEVSVTTPSSQPGFLVKDVNTFENAVGSNPSPTVVLGGVAYFSAQDDVYGRELWRTDGTAAGTRRVIDLKPGARDGLTYTPPGSDGHAGPGPGGMVAANGKLYFAGDDGSHGSELWSTDGTESGTVMVADATLGPGGTSPSQLTLVGDTIFFVGGDDRELWKSDGTPAGTKLVKDIRPGPVSSTLRNFMAWNGVLYFNANDGVSGYELWRSDGTDAGTYPLSDVSSATSGLGPDSLTVVGNTLYFVAYSDALGRELFKTDGTVAGTVLVADIRPGPATSEPQQLFAYGNSLLFSATDGTSGYELWRSDGTAAGTAQVADLAPGSANSSPFGFTLFNGKAYFLAMRPGFLQLYETDGTAAGTRLVKEMAGIAQNTPGILSAADGLYFIAAEGGVRLWKSDGTAEGTVPLSPALTEFPAGGTLSTAGTTVLFPAGETPAGGGTELWRSDGSASGTSILKNIRVSNRSSNPANLTAAGGRVYFTTAASTGVQAGLWVSDGTDAGTTLLRPGAASRLTVVGSTLFFVASDSASGTELWKTDGTVAGTALVKDVTPGAAGTTFQTFTAAATRLYFTIPGGGTSNVQLWISDGTAAGTTILSSEAAVLPNGPLRPAQSVAQGDRLYFRGGAAGVGAGIELWKTDGTAAGTALVKDVWPGTGNASPLWLTNVDGMLYFIATTPDGQSLWKTDGTDAGTVLVKQFAPAAPAVTNLTAVGDTLFFTAADAGSGAELWKSDGTAAGTGIVADLWPGAGGSSPAFLTAVGNSLFFIASDPTYGMGLWKTDGTQAGTQRIRPVYGPLQSSPFQIFGSGGTAFFTDAGYWWRSDGTPEGTLRLVQFTDTPSELQSLGSAAAATGGTVYVRGFDPEHGRELWGIPLPPVAGTASVVARHLYYGGSPAQPTASGAPVAGSARPLLPGQVSSSANYTSYARGINGILVDIAGLPTGGAPSAADFDLSTGNGIDWTSLGEAPSVTVWKGAGENGSDRLAIALPDYSVKNTWLRVTVKANARTGLARPDVFYFGNLVGDTGGTRTPIVDVQDLMRTRAAVGAMDATSVDRFDFNRDGLVDAKDVMIVRANQRRSLQLFTAPVSASTAATAAATVPPRGILRAARRSAWGEVSTGTTAPR